MNVLITVHTRYAASAVTAMSTTAPARRPPRLRSVKAAMSSSQSQASAFSEPTATRMWTTRRTTGP